LDEIENDMKKTGVSVENAKDRVKWKLRTRMANPQIVGKEGEEKEEEEEEKKHVITI